MKDSNKPLEKSILNEKWIENYFKFDLITPEDITINDFNRYYETELREKILNSVVGQMFGVDSNKSFLGKKLYYKNSLKKNPTITCDCINEKEGVFELLIRFVDKKPDEDINQVITYKEKEINDDRSYKFSPNESMIAGNIIRNVEFGLVSLLGLEQHELMTDHTFDENDNPIVTEFDGIQYFSFPFEKRIQLYLEDPNLEKKLFGLELKKYLKWVLDKEGKNEHMSKYCNKIKKLRDKYNI